MKTRSETKCEIYSVDIDFDAASEAWKTNKISQGNGTYRYCCMAVISKMNSQEKCSRKIVSPHEYCRRHICLTKNT